jgi:hypothetical protein
MGPRVARWYIFIQRKKHFDIVWKALGEEENF